MEPSALGGWGGVVPFWEMSHPYHSEKFPTANLAETGSSCREWRDRGRLWQTAGTPDEVPGCQRNKQTDRFLLSRRGRPLM